MLDSAVIQAGASFVLSASLGVFVALQRTRTPLHGVVMSLLFCFMGWTAGMLMVSGDDKSSKLAYAGMLLTFGSIMLLAPLWLFMCARLARVSIVMDRPRSSLIAFEIVEEHGGTLTVENSDLGGACFIMRLPVNPASGASPDPSE